MDKDPTSVVEAGRLMKRFNSHEKALGTDRRVRALALEEIEGATAPPPQVNRVETSTSGSQSLDMKELSNSINKLAELLTRREEERSKPVKCFSCGKEGHISRMCRSRSSWSRSRRRSVSPEENSTKTATKNE